MDFRRNLYDANYEIPYDVNSAGNNSWVGVLWAGYLDHPRSVGRTAAEVVVVQQVASPETLISVSMQSALA